MSFVSRSSRSGGDIDGQHGENFLNDKEYTSQQDRENQIATQRFCCRSIKAASYGASRSLRRHAEGRQDKRVLRPTPNANRFNITPNVPVTIDANQHRCLFSRLQKFFS
jgi:hypothetical protein